MEREKIIKRVNKAIAIVSDVNTDDIKLTDKIKAMYPLLMDQI